MLFLNPDDSDNIGHLLLNLQSDLNWKLIKDRELLKFTGSLGVFPLQQKLVEAQIMPLLPASNSIPFQLQRFCLT